MNATVNLLRRFHQVSIIIDQFISACGQFTDSNVRIPE